VGILLGGRSSPLLAQANKAPGAAPAAPGAGNQPEDKSLSTEDGLKLAITYFPGTKGKESIPVILLHAWKGSRQDFTKENGLAPYLQEKLGCAVVVPDLRGHGDSTSITKGDKVETIKAEKLQPAQFAKMVPMDLRAVKDFLWARNNAEELNLDKLCVVGIEMGATLALDYAVYDSVGYEQGRAFYGPLKLGGFVKGVVLVSPDMNFRGLSMRLALKSQLILKELPVMILAGSKGNPRWLNDAHRLYEIFSHRPAAADDSKESKTLWYTPLDTSLQGIKLVDEASLDVPKRIGQFIYYRLVKNPKAKDYGWQTLKLPHQ
jgi:pimeloyl-ACP methyl ester carboxylesterase